jgi:8-oxo-dGTP pyrophosphatase MutT (NUDIX family)
VYRTNPDGGIDLALAARRTRRGDLAWGLAKGQIEEGEDPRDTAVREVREETGLDADIEDDLGEISYFYVWDGVRIRKSVRFYLMRATGGDVSQHDHEMEEVRWFPMDDALAAASFKSERETLQRAVQQLRPG